MHFDNADGSFLNESTGAPVRIEVPLTGATITMKATDRFLFLHPAGTLATLTVKLPLGARNGESVEICSDQIITALTVNDGFGVAVTGAPTALAVGTKVQLRWTNTTANALGWKRWL